jgi:hypothetical protein
MSTYAQVKAAASSFRQALDPRPWASYDGKAGTGEGEVSYWVQMSQLAAALDVIDGLDETFEISPGPPPVTITRNVPLVHHRFAALYAYKYRVEEYYSPEAAGADKSSGPQAKISVSFWLPPWGVGADPYQDVRMTGTQQQLPADGATFSGGGTPAFEVTRPVSGSSYSVTVHDAPGFDETHEAYLNTMAGGLNDAVWRGNAIGTVQFHSPSVAYSLKRDGSRTASYTLQFDTRPFNFNYEFDRTGTLRQLLIGGSPRFNLISFGSLFV